MSDDIIYVQPLNIQIYKFEYIYFIGVLHMCLFLYLPLQGHFPLHFFLTLLHLARQRFAYVFPLFPHTGLRMRGQKHAEINRVNISGAEQDI